MEQKNGLEPWEDSPHAFNKIGTLGTFSQVGDYYDRDKFKEELLKGKEK